MNGSLPLTSGRGCPSPYNGSESPLSSLPPFCRPRGPPGVDIAVVGGGALGCGAALALAQRGHQVVLHERSSLGSGATAKAAGILSTLCHSDEEYRLIAETRGLIGETIALAMAAGE